MEKICADMGLAQPGHWEQTFDSPDHIPLLSAYANWPRLEGEGPGVKRLGRYYDALAQRWQRRWAGPLLERATPAVAEGARPWRAGLDFTVTYAQDGLLSLWWEAWEDTGERRRRRLRRGDTWRMPQGDVVTLPELLPPSRRWRRRVLSAAAEQIQARLEAGESVFYEDWPKRLAREFVPAQFYLSPAGQVTVFYQMETIAPALEGFPSFCLGPVANPPLPSLEEQASPGGRL